MLKSEQKMVLEKFLTHHDITMSATARLSHYGRRFSAFFPQIAAQANPEGKAWTSRMIGRLADIVVKVDPADAIKSAEGRLPFTPKKRRGGNRTREFLLSWEWRAIRFDTLQRRGRRCECCGATAKEAAIEVDHIKPISKHWNLRLDSNNLQVLCRPCNAGKGNRHLTDSRTG